MFAYPPLAYLVLALIGGTIIAIVIERVAVRQVAMVSFIPAAYIYFKLASPAFA